MEIEAEERRGTRRALQYRAIGV